jgi:hypothetical protein
MLKSLLNKFKNQQIHEFLDHAIGMSGVVLWYLIVILVLIIIKESI